ncbi:glycosyltransferase family A protein [Chryseolinea sp. T2]|uniref:glycosyltransferase family 2 protein n=1 Tax=Chryseolinea sp. T2 TaxID=3129255 RepID=UPI0030772672
MSPLISIVMPAFNAAKYIEASMSSVMSQSCKDWELVVVNDGSTDSTQEIVERYVKLDSRIKLVNQTNRKQAAARNTGIQNATGNWVAFLDADDTWPPNKLTEQLEVSHLGDVLYTSGVTYFEETSLQEHYQIHAGPVSGHEMFIMLYDWNPIPNLSVMVKREWIERVGFQNEHALVVGCEDWEYWIRLAKNGASFYGLDRELFIYRVHAGGTSRNRLRMKIAKVYAKACNLNAAIDDPRATSMFVIEVDQLLRTLLWENRTEDATRIIEQSRKAESLRYPLEYFLLTSWFALPGKLILACTKPLSFIKRIVVKFIN